MSEMMDNVVVRFSVQNQELLTGMRQAEQAIGNVSRAGSQVGRVSSSLGGMTRQSRGLTTQLGQQNRAIDASTHLLGELQSQTGNFTSSFRRAALSISTGTQWLDKFSIQADRASMAAWKFAMAGVSMQQMAMVTGTVAAGMFVVTKKMVDSFSLIDKLKRQFSTIYKSAEIGGQMVDQLVADAVKIRYSIDEVLEAGRLLALEGFNPKDLIYDMADLGAGVNQEGITIVNATRAFVDATNGQFRRLKETFQITREDAMAFAPDAFAGPNNQISNQAKATEAIIKAIRAKYRGQNDATMQTISGMMSNLDDAMVKSAAKMGTAIEGTVIGWIKSLMGMLEKVGDFAETDLGKATAQTLLWGTAILGAVTGLALLTGGMVTLLGVFAAYKVFMDGRSGTLSGIINAEMQLMTITQQLAAIEAQRSLSDINLMQARLALLQAIAAEDEQAIGRARTKVASFARPESRAAAEQLVRLRSGMAGTEERVIAADAGVSGAKKALATELDDIKQQKQIIQELGTTRNVGMLEKQVDYLDALTATQVTKAEKARAAANAALEKGADNADELLEKANLYEAQAKKTAESALQAEEKLMLSRRDRARIVQDGVTLESLETREVQARAAVEQSLIEKEAAQNALVEQRLALREAEQQLIETTPHRDVREALLAEMEGGGTATVDDTPKRQTDIVARSIAERDAELSRLMARTRAVRKVREKYQRQLADPLLWDESPDDWENARERRDRADRHLDKLGDRGKTIIAEEKIPTDSGVGKRVQLRRQLIELEKIEEGIQGRIADKTGFAKRLDEARLTAVKKRMVLLQAELVAKEESVALTHAQAAAEASAAVAVAGRVGVQFAGAAASGFGAVFAGIGGALTAAVGPIIAIFEALVAPLAGAIAAAGSTAAAFGVVTGAVAALAVVGLALYGVWQLLIAPSKKLQAELSSAAKSAEEFSQKLQNASTMFPVKPSEQAAAQQGEKFLKSLRGYEQTMGKMIVGEAMRPMKWAQTKGDMSDADSEQFAKDFWRYAQMSGKMDKSQQSELDAWVAKKGGWNNVTGKDMQELEGRFGAIRSGTLGKVTGQSDWEELIGGVKEAAQADTGSATAQSRQKLDAINAAASAEVENIRNLVTEYGRANTEAEKLAVEQKLHAQYGFESVDAARAFVDTADKTDNKADLFNQDLRDRIKHYQEMLPEIKDVNAALKEGREKGLSDEDIYASISADAKAAQDGLAGIETAQKKLQQLGIQITAEDLKQLEAAREKVRQLNQQKALFWDIVSMQKGQEMAGVGNAAGLPGMGAAFSGRNVAGNMAQYKTTKDTKYLTQAYADKMKSLDESQQVSLDLYAPGPRASAVEKAKYARYQARTERATRDSKRAVEDRAISDMEAMGATPAEIAEAKRGQAANDKKSANRAEEFEKQADDIDTQEKVGQLEAMRRMAAARGASERQLAQYDMEILRTKLAQAKANNDITAQMQLQAEAAEKIKQLSDAALNDEQAKLSFMQTQADQGLISEEAVEMEKQRLAKMYQERARQAAYGSAEYYANMQRALELLGDDTEDKWTGIIGKILGAPQELVNSVASGSFLSQFGDANAIWGGMDKTIKADIVSQRGSEILLRIRSDIPLESLDSKVRNAVEGIAPNIASQLSYALNYS